MMPSTVKEYICAPSQYTNGGYGQGIENTLTQNGGIVSLGNFGGYVTYEFADKIQNSNANPYGIDFKITGNAFNAAYTTQEPGQVWVSQNGEKETAIYYLKTAKGEGTPTETTESDSNLERIVGDGATINFSAFDGSVIVPQKEMTVSDGLAEQYGYEIAMRNHLGNRVDSVTVFDVLVAVHKEYYGDTFTPETAMQPLHLTKSVNTRFM